MKRFALALAALVLVAAAGCSKKSTTSPGESSAPADKFFLLLSSEGDTAIQAEFTSIDLSSIPTVVVNGYKCGDYGLGWSGMVISEGCNAPYSSVADYRISALGGTTSGTIEMPVPIDTVVCNATGLTYGGWTTVPYATSYSFSWTDCNCDGYAVIIEFVSRGLERKIDTFVTRPSITLSSNHDTLTYFYVYPVNGSSLLPGSTPNVSGAYGNGYVSAQGVGYFSDFRISGNSSKTVAHTRSDSMSGMQRDYHIAAKLLFK